MKKSLDALITEAQDNGASWIENENGITETVLDWAKDFASELSKKDGDKKELSTSQLRRFFGELKKIQNDLKSNEANFIMLRPQLAYAVGRDYDDKKKGTKTKIDAFYKALAHLINEKVAKNEKQFKNFVKILEAIVAYHKADEALKSIEL